MATNRSMKVKELRARKFTIEACLQESLKTCYLEQGKVRRASIELAKSAEASLLAWQTARAETARVERERELGRRAQSIRLRSHF